MSRIAVISTNLQLISSSFSTLLKNRYIYIYIIRYEIIRKHSHILELFPAASSSLLSANSSVKNIVLGSTHWDRLTTVKMLTV